MGQHSWVYADTKSKIKKVVEYCKQTGYCSHDFETAYPFHSAISFPTIIGISFQPGYSHIIPLGHSESVFKNDFIWILEYLNKHLFQNPDIIKIAYNLKYEHKWLLKYGLGYNGRIFDPMLMKYLLDETRPFSLEDQVKRFEPNFDGYKDETQNLAKKFGWANIPIDTLSKRCALDTDLTLRLFLRFERKLIKGNFYGLFRNLLMPLSTALAECEFRGMPVDSSYLDSLIKDYSQKINENETRLRSHGRIRRFERAIKRSRVKKLIKQLEDEIESGDLSDRQESAREKKISQYIAGNFVTKKEKKLVEDINFGSPAQLIELLFKHKKGFKFKIVSYTLKDKKPTNKPSTDESVLLALKEKDTTGFIQQLLDHRELQKLYSTYMVGVKKLISERSRVHTSFLIHGTETGRMSSRDPNLQNIPRSTTSSVIKKMFLPYPGELLLEVDYSQAELRIVAELANEVTMIKWFKEGKNIHVASACRAEKQEHRYDEIKKLLDDADAMSIEELKASPEHLFWVKRKKRAKTINFGILYEQSDKKLAETIGCSVEEAGIYKRNWFKDFPKIAKFVKDQHAFVRKHGYVKTMFGQKRRLPEVFNGVFSKVLQAERQSTNSPIQGSASQFTLFSIVLIRDEILKGNLPPMKLLYTVHDSIGYSIKPEHIHYAMPIIKKICANPETQKYFGFEMKKVNMKVSGEVGINWGELKDYNPTTDYTTWLKPPSAIG